MAFLAGVSLQLHGWSLPLWHQVIAGEDMPEVLLGSPRPIRSDDWVVGLPYALAQVAHEPAFPRVNTNVGEGQDMLLMEMPIAHPVTLFRPASWGFFLAGGLGAAWMWWFQVLGLTAACFLALRVMSGGRTALAALGALLVTFSPFMQFWSFAPARVTVYAGLMIAAWAALWQARRPAQALTWGALLGWAAACFALVLYPPFQISLGWVVLAVAVGLLVERAREPGLRSHLGMRLGGLGLAGAIAGVAVLGFWLAAEPSIERMLETVYPGRRHFTGGDLPLWRLFGHDLGVALFAEDWSAWINISEASGFWLLFPVAALGVRRGGRTDPVAAALLGCIVLLGLHTLVGLPDWLARLTLLSEVHPARAVIGIGFADALLLVRVFSRSEPVVADPQIAAVLALAWTGALLACVPPLQRAFPELPTAGLGAWALLNAVLAWALLRHFRPVLALGGAVALLSVTTLGFNPLVRGGVDYLYENPLSRHIVAIDREMGGESTWLTYGSPYIANLFRALGVRSLNGFLALPQLELWRRVDPDRRYDRFYNRVGHFTAASSDAPGASFRMAGEAVTELVTSPGSEAARELGVTHVLIVAPDPSGPDAVPGIERVASYRWNHLYRLVPSSDAPDAGP